MKESEKCYADLWQADIRIFNRIPIIPLGNGLILRGILANSVETEAEYYFKVSHDELVKKHLPSSYPSSLEESTEKIYDLIKRFVLKASILFVISFEESLQPIGYILFNSPLTKFLDEKLTNQWTVDFWLLEKVRRNGIIACAVNIALGYLKDMDVPEVYAYVTSDNKSSVNVLSKSGFGKIGKTPDSKYDAYYVKLK